MKEILLIKILRFAMLNLIILKDLILNLLLIVRFLYKYINILSHMFQHDR